MTAWLPLLVPRRALLRADFALNDDPYPEIVCRLMGEGHSEPGVRYPDAARAQTLDSAAEDRLRGRDRWETSTTTAGWTCSWRARTPADAVALAGGGKNTFSPPRWS
jgi:hypothetical protein